LRRAAVVGAADQPELQLFAHFVATHAVEQQSAFVAHVLPTSAHMEVGAPHAAGAPPQPALQQSAADEHDAPSARHAAVHTRTPPDAAPHVPRQQSASPLHGVPFGRHGPGPKSHRLSWVSHEAQHAAPPPDVQSSPVARQLATASSAHF